MRLAVGFSLNVYNYYQHPFNTAFQYNHYQQSCIEIQEEQTAQLQEQIVLLQSLCEKIIQEVELGKLTTIPLRDRLTAETILIYVSDTPNIYGQLIIV